MPGKKPENARERAAELLGRRPHSKIELKNKLLQKGETEQDALEAVNWLEEIGALDDRSYASTLVRHYSQKGCGPARIREEFYVRGIPREMWDEALEEMPDMSETLDALVQKRLKGEMPAREQRQKTAAAIMRKGFSWDEVSRAIERYENERNS